MKSSPITRSARDEICTMQIVGYCNFDPQTTVFAHYPMGEGGSNKLLGDLSGGYICSSCHDVIDGRRKADINREDREYYMRRSTWRTLKRLIDRGFVTVVGLTP